MNRLNRKLFLSLVVIWLVFGVSSVFVRAQTLPQDVLNAYQEVESKTQIPVRLPQSIPLNSPAAPEANSVWASVTKIEETEYIISLDRAEDCSNVIECSFGKLRAYKLIGDEASIEELYVNVIDPENAKGEVTLENGLQVYYVPFEAGLYEPAIITWEEDGVRYELWLYMASKDDVVAMANSIFSEDSSEETDNE